MRKVISICLVYTVLLGQNTPKEIYNPCDDPLLKIARLEGIKSVPIKDIRRLKKLIKQCERTQENGEKKVSEIYESDWKRDFESARIFSSWTSTYSIIVFMTMLYYYIGMIYATEPGDDVYKQN
tara:strand:+ start:147 stop:518 length:372 start_codon:yes stop_codon:yes gene_type:complete